MMDFRCPHCQSALVHEPPEYECSSCKKTVGKIREQFVDFMLDVELDDDYQEFYERGGTEGDEAGGPRISAQRFKVPNILRVLPEDYQPRRWLDMGCGGGWIMEALLENWQSEAVVGLDISATRLTEARRRNPSAQFLRGPVEGVPLPDDSFDLATSLDVIEHIPDPEQLLREAHRLSERLVIKFPIEDTLFDRFQKEFWWPLKRWTKVLIREEGPEEYFEPHLHRFHFEDARNLLRKNGFKIMDEYISENPFEDNHATMYPPAYNITPDTPLAKRLDFHLKRLLIVGAMRGAYLILPFWYYRIFSSGIYLYAKRA